MSEKWWSDIKKEGNSEGKVEDTQGHDGTQQSRC